MNHKYRQQPGSHDDDNYDGYDDDPGYRSEYINYREYREPVIGQSKAGNVRLSSNQQAARDNINQQGPIRAKNDRDVDSAVVKGPRWKTSSSSYHYSDDERDNANARYRGNNNNINNVNNVNNNVNDDDVMNKRSLLHKSSIDMSDKRFTIFNTNSSDVLDIDGKNVNKNVNNNVNKNNIMNNFDDEDDYSNYLQWKKAQKQLQRSQIKPEVVVRPEERKVSRTRQHEYVTDDEIPRRVQGGKMVIKETGYRSDVMTDGNDEYYNGRRVMMERGDGWKVKDEYYNSREIKRGFDVDDVVIVDGGGGYDEDSYKKGRNGGVGGYNKGAIDARGGVNYDKGGQQRGNRQSLAVMQPTSNNNKTTNTQVQQLNIYEQKLQAQQMLQKEKMLAQKLQQEEMLAQQKLPNKNLLAPHLNVAEDYSDQDTLCLKRSDDEDDDATPPLLVRKGENVEGAISQQKLPQHQQQMLQQQRRQIVDDDAVFVQQQSQQQQHLSKSPDDLYSQPMKTKKQQKEQQYPQQQQYREQQQQYPQQQQYQEQQQQQYPQQQQRQQQQQQYQQRPQQTQKPVNSQKTNPQRSDSIEFLDASAASKQQRQQQQKSRGKIPNSQFYQEFEVVPLGSAQLTQSDVSLANRDVMIEKCIERFKSQVKDRKKLMKNPDSLKIMRIMSWDLDVVNTDRKTIIVSHPLESIRMWKSGVGKQFKHVFAYVVQESLDEKYSCWVYLTDHPAHDVISALKMAIESVDYSANMIQNGDDAVVDVADDEVETITDRNKFAVQKSANFNRSIEGNGEVDNDLEGRKIVTTHKSAIRTANNDISYIPKRLDSVSKYDGDVQQVKVQQNLNYNAKINNSGGRDFNNKVNIDSYKMAAKADKNDSFVMAVERPPQNVAFYSSDKPQHKQQVLSATSLAAPQQNYNYEPQRQHVRYQQPQQKEYVQRIELTNQDYYQDYPQQRHQIEQQPQPRYQQQQQYYQHPPRQQIQQQHYQRPPQHQQPQLSRNVQTSLVRRENAVKNSADYSVRQSVQGTTVFISEESDTESRPYYGRHFNSPDRQAHRYYKPASEREVEFVTHRRDFSSPPIGNNRRDGNILKVKTNHEPAFVTRNQQTNHLRSPNLSHRIVENDWPKNSLPGGPVSPRIALSQAPSEIDSSCEMECLFLGLVKVNQATGSDVIRKSSEILITEVPTAKWSKILLQINPQYICAVDYRSPDDIIYYCSIKSVSYVGISPRNPKFGGFISSAKGGNQCYICFCEPTANKFYRNISAACQECYYQSLQNQRMMK